MNSENNGNERVPLPENICPKCGRKDRLEVKYCSECGTPLVEEGELEKYLKWKKIANVLKALIIAAIIAAAAGIIYVNQQKGAAGKPYVSSINVADNHESDKNRITQLEKEKAEAEQKAAVEAEKIKQEKDQIAQEKKADDEETAQSANNYNVGDIIEFGSYPYYENGTEKAIEWKILEKYSDGTALVISKYALDALRYNETSINITWEKSTIRKWLNNDFYNKAFGNVNKNLILNNHLENKGHSIWTTSGGKNTWDYIFLLSTDEARKYFDSEKSRVTEATPYAEKKGVATISYLKENKYNEWKEKIRQWDADGVPDSSCRWWLRSPGSNQKLAVYVSHGGYVRDGGKDVNGIQNASIRPAFKINLDKFAQQ